MAANPAIVVPPTRAMQPLAAAPAPKKPVHLYGATSDKMERNGFSVAEFLIQVKGFDKGQMALDGTGSLHDGHGNWAAIAKVTDPESGAKYSTVNFASTDGCPLPKPGTATYLVMEDMRNDSRMGNKVLELDAVAVMTQTIQNRKAPGFTTFKSAYAAAKENVIGAEFKARRDASLKAAIAEAQKAKGIPVAVSGK